MSLSCDLPVRNLKALVSALLKLDFYDDASVSLELIQSQLFGKSAMEADAVAAFLATLREMLAEAAKGHWTMDALQEKLSAANMAAEHVGAAVSIWRSDRDKVQAVLMRRSTYNSRMKDVAWRVDVATNSKRVKEVDEPVAIVELNTDPGVGAAARTVEGSATGSVVRFELSRDEMKRVLGQFAVIEARLDAHLQ